MRVYHDRLVNSTDKQLLINSAALIARSLLSQTDKKEV
jgi:outer membrane biosynthesis protein TonB